MYTERGQVELSLSLFIQSSSKVIKNHIFIMHTAKKWPLQRELFSQEGRSKRLAKTGKLSSNDGHVIVNGALNGLGIGFGPDFLFENHIRQGRLKRILEDYYTPPAAISALYPLNRNLSKRVRILIDFLAERLANKA